ncbi:MAG: MFS transporter, partial [Ilumatobacter sp.]|nr:MFS transporter [Ilumatobacter sp.]
TFLLDGVSYLAVLWGLWRMNTTELRRPERTPRQKGQVLSGFRYAHSEHELWVPLVMMTIIGTLAFNFSVFMPVLVDKTFGRPVVWYTVLMSAMSIGSVVGALITARRREVAVRDLVRASVGFGLALLALAATPWFPLTLPVVVLIGLGSIMFMTTSTTIVQLRCRPEMRGRVLALQAMVFLGSTPIGGPVIGVISEFGGARAGIVVGGLACLGAATYGWMRDRTLHAPTHVPVTPPDVAAQIASSS